MIPTFLFNFGSPAFWGLAYLLFGDWLTCFLGIGSPAFWGLVHLLLGDWFTCFWGIGSTILRFP